MNNSAKWMVVLAVVIAGAAVSGQQNSVARGRVAFSHELPRLEGDHLKVSVVEVVYGPGESSPSHTHPCPVIAYVAEGSLRTQVQGGPETVYRAGEMFYEPPNIPHSVSLNAGTDRARLIAYFTCDRDAPLTVPAR